MNAMSLHASSEHFKSNSSDSKKTHNDEEKNDAATKIQRSFHKSANHKVAKREILTQEKATAVYESVDLDLTTPSPLQNQTQKMDEIAAEEKSALDFFKDFFGKSPEEYNAECKRDLEIRNERKLALLSNPEAAKAAEIVAKAASDAADAYICKVYEDTKFIEANVQVLLETFSYLTAEELQIQLKRCPHETCIIYDSFQRSKDEYEAIRRKAIQEAAGNVDSRPLVDRMIAHANLNEIQQANIESYRSMSLQEIASNLSLSLEELENKLYFKAYDDIAPENHDAYSNICKEMYKSKKSDEIIKTYKDYTAQEMCDEINELHEITPESELLLEINEDVLLLKMKVEMMDYTDQHNGIFNQKDFYASRKDGTATVPTWARCNTEQELKAAIDQKCQQMIQEQARIKDAVKKIERSFRRFLNRKATLKLSTEAASCESSTQA